MRAPAPWRQPGVFLPNPEPAVLPGYKQVYIFCLQSNCVGANTVASLPAALHAPDPRVMFNYVIGDPVVDQSAGWIDLQGWQANTKFGPERTFGSYMADQGQDIAIIKYAVNGTGLQPKWIPTAALYPKLVTNVTAALSTIGVPYQLRALVAVGCETDADSLPFTNNIPTNFAAFMAQFRSDFAVPNLRLIISRLSNLQTALLFLPQAQAKENSFVPTDVNARIVTTDDVNGMSINPDFTHYNSSGGQVLGTRLGRTCVP